MLTFKILHWYLFTRKDLSKLDIQDYIPLSVNACISYRTICSRAIMQIKQPVIFAPNISLPVRALRSIVTQTLKRIKLTTRVIVTPTHKKNISVSVRVLC